MKKQYTTRDLQGEFGFSFDGTVTLGMPDGSSMAAPLSAVGRVDFDGEGVTEGARLLSFGGMILLEQIAHGTYSVNHNGTGIAKYVVVSEKMIGEPPPGVALPPKNIETFSFVLSNDNKELQFIGTGFLDAETETPLAAVSARGICRKQN